MKFKEFKIIETLQEEQLISEWININNYSAQLLYRCSKDGDLSKTFHEKCNGKSPTIVFIKTKDNLKIGGYTTTEWNDRQEFSSDKNAFIFSLTNKKKYFIKKSNEAIWGGSVNGPIFGTNEIYIRNQCSSEGGENSYPSSYNFNEKGELVGGKTEFEILEYEVYLIKRQ